MFSISAAIIEDAIYCVHGGLSPESYNPDLVILNTAFKIKEYPKIIICRNKFYLQIMNIERTTGVPVEGLLCDTLWSDPSKVIY